MRSNNATPIVSTLSDTHITALGYAYAQLTNLAIQLILIQQLGKAQYGKLGFIWTLSVTIIFLCEAGYPNLLIREIQSAKDWQKPWTQACAHRLIVCIAISTASIVAIQSFYDEEQYKYFMGALPALLLSLFIPTPIFYGLNNARKAALTQPIQMTTQLIATIALTSLVEQNNIHFPTLLGMTFSTGYLAAVIFGFSAFGMKLLPCKAVEVNLSLLKSSITMWLMSLSGSVYFRLIIIVIERSQPSLLAAYIIFEQIMQGLNGVLGHLQRLFIPKTITLLERGENNKVLTALKKYSVSIIILTMILTPSFTTIYGMTSEANANLTHENILTLWALSAEWSLRYIGLALTMYFICTNTERRYSILVISLQAVSILAQLSFLSTEYSSYIFGIRVVSAAATVLLAAYIAKLQIVQLITITLFVYTLYFVSICGLYNIEPQKYVTLICLLGMAVILFRIHRKPHFKS